MPNKRWMVSFLIVFVVVSLFFLIACGPVKKYEATWESLKTHPAPEWFDDAKFGIFIHWGVYSVPGWAPVGRNAEWYPHNMYKKGTPTYEYHRKHYDDQKTFGYKDFVPLFKAEKWNPEAWAALFEEAGARYIVPVAEHHDGFAMWDSELTRWDAMDMGPKRDIIGELGEAVRKRGMKYAPSYHRARHWYYYDYLEEFDLSDSAYAGLYLKPHGSTPRPGPHPDADKPSKEFLDDWKKRWEEYRDKYKPDFLWFDGMWGLDSAYLEYDKQIMADYYNKALEWGKDVGVNNKGGTFRRNGLVPSVVGDWIEGDYMSQDRILDIKWQNPLPVGRSYGFNRNEKQEDYSTTDELIDEFVDIVSKNGNLLLNIGPRADGTIQKIQQERLRGIGKWLETNGEAIYGTRPWKVYGEGTIRFTKKENVVFAILLEWQEDPITISSLKSGELSVIRSVRMLGSGAKIDFTHDADGLRVQLPREKPCNHAWVFEIRTN